VRYVVIEERGENGFGANGPDLPDRVAVGETKDEALRSVQEAISSCTRRACAKRTQRRPNPPLAASTWRSASPDRYLGEGSVGGVFTLRRTNDEPVELPRKPGNQARWLYFCTFE
jgi:predicted RNase H-like HicB family nuclease